MFWRSDKSGARPDRQVKLLVTASESLKHQVVGKPDDENDDLDVSEVGNKLKLSGQSASLESHNRARQSLDEKSTATVDASRLGFDSQVQIDIKVVEVSRSRLQNAGLFFGKKGANSTYALSSPGNLTGVQSIRRGWRYFPAQQRLFPHAQAFNFVYGNASEGILGVISVLENNGFAYTLAEPSLVAMSGQSTNFLAGGEYPVLVPQGGVASTAITITYKEFGIRLSLTPTVLNPNPIALKVAPEVSELDFSVQVQSGGVQVPGLRIRRTDTSISLGNGESFIISGLVSQNTLANLDKFSWLGDLPILGAFFRSTHFERSDRELIMVVMPHLVQALAKEAPLPPLPGERYRQYDPDFFQVFFQEQGRFQNNPPCPIGIFEITT